MRTTVSYNTVKYHLTTSSLCEYINKTLSVLYEKCMFSMYEYVLYSMYEYVQHVQYSMYEYVQYVRVCTVCTSVYWYVVSPVEYGMLVSSISSLDGASRRAILQENNFSMKYTYFMFRKQYYKISHIESTLSLIHKSRITLSQKTECYIYVIMKTRDRIFF